MNHEREVMQYAFERAMRQVAGRNLCNPTPRSSRELMALLDAKIERQKREGRYEN